MSEVAEKAGEVAAEVVEETVDGVVDVVEVVRTNPKLVVLAGLVGAAAGAAGGYFFAKNKLKSFYEDLAAEEIGEAKRFYANLNKVDVESGDVLSPMEVLERTHPAAAASLREYQGEKVEDLETALDEQDEAQIARIEERVRHQEPEVEVTVNVFDDPTFDLVEETKYRTEDKPYIITHDEYFAAEKDYEQISLTYYEQDDTLTDESDKPINEIDQMVGEDHLVRFGHGSKDKNIVYVRNDRLASDFEIIKSTGSYVEEVLGMLADEPNSLKHSDQLAARRAFRHGDG